MELDNLGWMIEGGGSVKWWDGRGVDTFSADPNEGVRFARFEDAERVRCWLLKPEIRDFCKSTQHKWFGEVNVTLPDPAKRKEGGR